MEIMFAVNAASFEANNVVALYHYRDVLLSALPDQLRQDVQLALGMFRGTLANPEYGVKSTVSGDSFIAFQHDDEVAVLVNKHGEFSLFMREQPEESLVAWLTTFVRHYLRKYNPDNLACFPAPIVPVKATTKKRKSADASAKKPKSPVTKAKTTKRKPTKRKTVKEL